MSSILSILRHNFPLSATGSGVGGGGRDHGSGVVSPADHGWRGRGAALRGPHLGFRPKTRPGDRSARRRNRDHPLTLDTRECDAGSARIEHRSSVGHAGRPMETHTDAYALRSIRPGGAGRQGADASSRGAGVTRARPHQSPVNSITGRRPFSGLKNSAVSRKRRSGGGFSSP